MLTEGLVLDGSRGQYRVQTPKGVLLCAIRGRLRKRLEYALSDNTSARKSVKAVKVKHKDPVAVGDRVRVLITGGDTGVIEEVLARASGSFTRGDPQRGQGQLTSIAGLDQLIAVFAAREPEPHLGLLDRFLVLAESQEIAAIVCLNKLDLGIALDLAERLEIYRELGYPVLLTSAVTGAGLDALRQCLPGRTSALLGPSGVGKSSLLNALQPDLGQKVNAVSASTGKGIHTTRGTRLVPLDGPEGGYIADTAGIRALALTEQALHQLDWCFREFRPYLGACRLNDCTHLHEPGCAVREALRRGAIDRVRHNSYRRLQRGGTEALAADWDDVE